MDGWNITFLLGRPIFKGYVSFREGNHSVISRNVKAGFCCRCSPCNVTSSKNYHPFLPFFVGIRMDVSKNRCTPKSSILIGFSIINHPFWGPTPLLGNTRMRISLNSKQHGSSWRFFPAYGAVELSMLSMWPYLAAGVFFPNMI